MLRSSTYDAEIVRRVRRASRRFVPIGVDDQLVQFRVVESDDAWGRAAAIDDFELALSGRGLEPDEIQLPDRRPAASTREWSSLFPMASSSRVSDSICARASCAGGCLHVAQCCREALE